MTTLYLAHPCITQLLYVYLKNIGTGVDSTMSESKALNASYLIADLKFLQRYSGVYFD